MFAFHDRFINDFFNVPSYSRRLALPQRSYGSLIPRDNFFGDFFQPTVFRESFYYNPSNEVKLDEQDGQYVISFEDENINKKELKVDYLKRENQLRIQIAEKQDSKDDTNETHYSSNYYNSISFDKKVNSDDIKASIDGNKISIVVPKVESDAGNIVNVQITGNDNVQPLIDSKGETDQGKVENKVLKEAEKQS